MRLIILFLVAFQPIRSFGQQTLTLSAPAYGSSFQEIKTYQEQALELGGTKTQAREFQRNILRARYGQAGVEKMFQTHSPNPTIEGIQKTTRLAASGNPNQAKGYKRTLLYEKEFTRGGKFEVVATDKIIKTRFGETDVDLWLKHKETGENVLVEVKENKLAGQNLENYKLKVQRLSDYAERHGGRVVFLNRDELKPEFKEFATKHGVLTYENVATGKLTGQKPGNLPFREMERNLGQRVASATTTEATELAGLQTAGIWLRRAGIVGILGYEGYTIQGALSGRLSEREFVTAQSTIVGSGFGGWAGAKTGALLGTAIVGGPEDPLAAITAPAGAVIGGIVGVIVGGKIGENVATGIYGRLDDKQRRQVDAFIYEQYGVTRTR